VEEVDAGEVVEVDVEVLAEVDVEGLVDAEVLVVGSEEVDVGVEVAADVPVVEELEVAAVVDVDPGLWRPQLPAKRAADTTTQVTSAKANARFKENLLIESFAGGSYGSASRSVGREPVCSNYPTPPSSQYWISALE
jgi:hypothetical protein